MEQKTLLGELVCTLQDEGDALAAGDAGLLGEVTARKNALLARLLRLRQAGQGDSAADRARLRHAQRLNSINARLLAAQMRANGARLDALLHAGAGESLYGAGGAINRNPGAPRALASA
jgi:flagellar biosynthesis/type III secretory pathway chaperone